jgi:hypothetical protein
MYNILMVIRQAEIYLPYESGNRVPPPLYVEDKVRFMVFNATFNNISVISRLSVLLVEETRSTHRPVTSH